MLNPTTNSPSAAFKTYKPLCLRTESWRPQALEGRDRRAAAKPVHPYIYTPLGFQARMSPEVRRLIMTECARSANRSHHLACDIFRELSSEYCTEHRANGWGSKAQAIAALRRACLKVAEDAGQPVEASDYVVSRLWGLFERAGVLLISRQGRYGSAILCVHLHPDVLEVNGSLAVHMEHSERQAAAAREQKRAQRARQRQETHLAGLRDASTGKRVTNMSGFLGASNRPADASQGISRHEPNKSTPTDSASPDSYGIHTEPYGVSLPAPGVSHPRPHRPTPKSLHKDSNPSGLSNRGLGAFERGQSTPPPLDLPAAKDSSPETGSHPLGLDAEKIENSGPKGTLTVNPASSSATSPAKAQAAGVGCRNEAEQGEKAKDDGKVGRPEPVVGIAAAPRVGPVAETPPESSHKARGDDFDTERPTYEDLQDPARLKAWLAARNAKKGAARPPALKPPPLPDGADLSKWTVKGMPGEHPAEPVIPPRRALEPGETDPADLDCSQLWTTPAAAYDALDELSYRRATAGEARSQLGEAAWAAAMTVKAWDGWLEAADEPSTWAAFRAYERAIRARGGTLQLPDGVPRDAGEMVRHVVQYMKPGAAVVGVNGQALVALRLPVDLYLDALNQAAEARRLGKVADGKPLAAYLLAIARRLAGQDEAG